MERSPRKRARSALLCLLVVAAAAAAHAQKNADPAVVKARVKAHVTALESKTAGEYEASLVRLRAEGKAAALAAHELYQEAAPTEYVTRWGLVMTLGELRTPDAVPGLRAVALEPLGAATAIGHGSADEDEATIRIRAMAGLGRLAGTGDKNALGALRECTRLGDRGLRATAVFELMEATRLSGGDVAALKKSLGAQLGKLDAWMLTLHVADLTKEGGVLPVVEAPKNNGGGPVPPPPGAIDAGAKK